MRTSRTTLHYETMLNTSDHDSRRQRRHAKIRRLKRILRWVPRRATFHRYPLVGRFAAVARRRAYLWSLKPRHVRPAIYLGSIVSLWPVIGLQLAVAFAGAVLLRANLMVAGVLQLVSNPLTAGPLYYVTYRVGKGLLFPTERTAADAPGADAAGEVIMEALETHAELTFGFTQVVAALFAGGIVCGLLMAVVLDFLYVWSMNAARQDR